MAANVRDPMCPAPESGLGRTYANGPAKAGLSQLMRVMALEWVGYGIRANAIAPGFMDTPLAAPIWADPERSRWIFNRVPVERLGPCADLVRSVAPRCAQPGPLGRPGVEPLEPGPPGQGRTRAQIQWSTTSTPS